MSKNNFDTNKYYMHNNGNVVLLILYIDNLFVIGSNNKLIIWLKNYLQSMFAMIDLEIIQQYLERISRGIFIHQTKHVENILKKFKILGFRFAYTPLLEGLVLVNNTKSTLCNVTFFCKLVEKLIFLIITRLDIAYALNS